MQTQLFGGCGDGYELVEHAVNRFHAACTNIGLKLCVDFSTLRLD